MTFPRPKFRRMQNPEQLAYMAKARVVHVAKHERYCRVRRKIVTYFVAVIRGIEMSSMFPSLHGWRTPDRALRDGWRIIKSCREAAT